MLARPYLIRELGAYDTETPTNGWLVIHCRYRVVHLLEGLSIDDAKNDGAVMRSRCGSIPCRQRYQCPPNNLLAKDRGIADLLMAWSVIPLLIRSELVWMPG